MQVIMRADASSAMGIGHVMRCLTLAQGFQRAGWRCTFVSRAFEGHLADLVRAKGFDIHLLPAPDKEFRISDPQYSHEAWLGVDWATDAAETEDVLRQHNVRPEWIVVDNYAIDHRWEERFRSPELKLFVIDDLADREHAADILVDQNYYLDFEQRYDALVPQTCHKLLGPRYALLRPEFRAQREMMQPRDGSVRRIVVFYGGADYTRQTMKALGALAWTESAGITVDVVTGASNPLREEIREACLARTNLTFHCQVDTMAILMAQADLALAAGGSVTWELACMGVPACLTVVADNQRQIVNDLAARNLTVVAGDADVTFERLGKMARSLADDEARRQAIHDALRKAVDGRGLSRVVESLLGKTLS